MQIKKPIARLGAKETRLGVEPKKKSVKVYGIECFDRFSGKRKILENHPGDVATYKTIAAAKAEIKKYFKTPLVKSFHPNLKPKIVLL